MNCVNRPVSSRWFHYEDLKADTGPYRGPAGLMMVSQSKGVDGDAEHLKCGFDNLCYGH